MSEVEWDRKQDVAMPDWPRPERALAGPRVSLKCHLALDCQPSGTVFLTHTSLLMLASKPADHRVICGYQSWSERSSQPLLLALGIDIPLCFPARVWGGQEGWKDVF